LLPDGFGSLFVPEEYFGGVEDCFVPEEYFGVEGFGPDEYFGVDDWLTREPPKLALRDPKLLLRELKPLLLRPLPYFPASACGVKMNAAKARAQNHLRNICPPCFKPFYLTFGRL
jgi:hypothetical protein